MKPLRNLSIIAVAIFLIESFIMHLISLRFLPSYLEAIADSLILIVTAFPILYWFVYRPKIKYIEKLKVAEKKAEEANRLKSEFVANISHEVRTPLTLIIGMAELMKDGNLNNEQRNNLRILEKESLNLLGIINDILDISKIETGRMEIVETNFDLQSEISSLIGILKNETDRKGLELISSLDANVPLKLRGDFVRLRQILENLIENAIKFTKHGKISLSITLNDTIQRQENRVNLFFKVSDTGVGIPKEKHEHIFDSFVQASSSIEDKCRGTGLGLAITKKLINMMGGNIWVESEEGKGSNFFFTVSFDLQKTSSAINQDTETNQDINTTDQKIKPLKILIVEDDENLRRLFERFLSPTDYVFNFAENGKIAVDLFNINKYNIVLMDMNMPVMDGYSATKMIRDIEKKEGRNPIPIVAVTAHALTEHMRKCIDAGCSGHYSKPINRSELISIIESNTEWN